MLHTCSGATKDKRSKCLWCGELVEAFGYEIHPECNLRMVIGSVAHVEKRCGCFVPGSEENDPPDMSKREAAMLAVRALNKANGY